MWRRTVRQNRGYAAETDGNISIISTRPILSLLVSVSVSFLRLFLSLDISPGIDPEACAIFCKVLAEFLLSKASVSVSVPRHFPGISISIDRDLDHFQVSVSVSVSL